MQNPFAENIFRIASTVLIRIHATMVRLKRRLQTVQAALIALENFNRFSPRDTDKFIHDLSPNRLQH